MRLLFHALLPFAITAFHLFQFDGQCRRNRNHQRKAEGRYHQAEERETEDTHPDICTDFEKKFKGLRAHFSNECIAQHLQYPRAFEDTIGKDGKYNN